MTSLKSLKKKKKTISNSIKYFSPPNPRIFVKASGRFSCLPLRSQHLFVRRSQVSARRNVSSGFCWMVLAIDPNERRENWSSTADFWVTKFYPAATFVAARHSSSLASTPIGSTSSLWMTKHKGCLWTKLYLISHCPRTFFDASNAIPNLSLWGTTI